MSLVSATGSSSAVLTGGSSSTVLTGCTSLTTYLAGAAHLASITGTFHITGTGAGTIISRASCTMLTRPLISRPGFFRKDLLVACLVLSRSKSQWARAQTQYNANNP